MGLPETVEFFRNITVMVRARGPDPKGMKMRKHAFHQYNSGKTTLSASGMLLPHTLYDVDVANRILDGNGEGLVLVLTVASVVAPFLSQHHRKTISQGRPALIPGAQIDVLLEEKLSVENGSEGKLEKGGSSWCIAQLIRLVDVPVSSLALQSLTEASIGSTDHGWEIGWSLASHNNSSQTNHSNTSFTVNQRNFPMGESGNSSLMVSAATMAVLGIQLNVKDLPAVTISPSIKRGDFLLAMGSPFGVLSPMHFFNSISVGSVANCYPPKSPVATTSLLMADIRCLPGMEGGPVFSENADFIGILIRPLRQKSTGAEIQLVIPWEAIATACSDLLLKEPQNAEKEILINKENLNAVGNAFSHKSDDSFCYKYNHFNLSSRLPVQKAVASICLITIDEGVWASGVLLNNQGLILTNAHLLEPWRFGKTTVYGGRNGTEPVPLVPPEEYEFHRYEEVEGQEKGRIFPSKTTDFVDSSLADDNRGYRLNFSHRGHRNIRARLDHVDPWIWYDAKVVYICKGPLDVALLKLEYFPEHLCPINVDFRYPSLGSKAYVIGHGLFGPRSGLPPSVCSGVVAKVVKIEAHAPYKSIDGVDSQIPAMLETTAAVHPGGSGGAVLNSEGHMIGLVTSNARHGGGSLIPHLNFSIPCAVLAPIFEFAKGMQRFSLLQNLDQPNERLSSVWALVPSLSPKPRPRIPGLPLSPIEDTDEQGKGSKFAKFIAERDKSFGRPAQFGKPDSISNIIHSSKL